MNQPCKDNQPAGYISYALGYKTEDDAGSVSFKMSAWQLCVSVSAKTGVLAQAAGTVSGVRNVLNRQQPSAQSENQWVATQSLRAVQNVSPVWSGYALPDVLWTVVEPRACMLASGWLPVLNICYMLLGFFFPVNLWNETHGYLYWVTKCKKCKNIW